MEKNTYTILEEKREDMEKKLRRLEKKAQKYGIPFATEYGEPYVITKNHRNEFDQIVENKYEVFDLTIESDTIRKDGYTVLAHIEHSPTGNVVDVFHGEMQKEWVSCEPFCEHCNSNHNLRYTFMVSNGNEIKQVGRTCLKEYCGIDPQMVGMMNAFFEDIEDCTPDGYDFGEPIPCVYDAVLTLALAIDTIDKQGYVKSDEYKSNKGEIIRQIATYHPSKDVYDRAVSMASVIQTMDIEDAISAYLNNVQARLKGFYCKPSDFGYFAYAPVAYEKYLKKLEEKERRENEREELSMNSEYIGTVGERAEFDIKGIKMLTSFATNYGYTYLYRLIEKNDNVMVWFASNTLEDADFDKLEKGGKIKATVKAHSERDGVKQTVITRVKVA